MSRLLPALLGAALLASAGGASAAVRLIFDPAAPGPNAPPAGSSRFDQLFLRADGRYAVPYPVERLIEYLDGRLDNGRRTGVRQALIPRGRSLQREAPAPDYFRFPRLVIATEGEPAGDLESAGLVMEYRLFIAHQPKTESLEIISYNDAAGRFEFQLIEGYGPGRQQRALPVSRAMCASCHHNGAPIFARNPWSETSFNVRVAQRLADEMPQRYRSMIEILSLDAGVIDVLSERANYLSAAQLVWREACTTRACRAAMLRAVLQYRLSGESDFDRGGQGYRQDYVAELGRNWQSRWPGGLALPGSRIPDRDPFDDGAADGALDPLLPRPPQATWHEVDAALADGIITRLAGFLTRRDVARLDAALLGLADQDGTRTRRYRADCRPAYRDSGITGLECHGSADAAGMLARLEIESAAGRVTGVGIVSMKLPGTPNLLQPETGPVARSNGELVVEIGSAANGLSQRLGNGDRLVRMTLGADEPGSGAPGWFEIEIVDDFRFVEAALRRLVENLPPEDYDPLADGVFGRQRIMRALAAELGIAPPPATQVRESADSPVPRAQPDLQGGLALLEPYCAHCHADGTRHPPGFLASPAPLEAIAACAPRMLARLRAWQPHRDNRLAPMPPPMSLGLAGASAASWPASGHYRSLVASLENLIEERFGGAAARRWKAQDYTRLPSCRVEFNG